jgi:hypothetical protein
MPLNQQMLYDPTSTTQLFLPPDMLLDENGRLSTGTGTVTHRHRRARRRGKPATTPAPARWLRFASLLLAGLAAALVAMLSVLGGLISYQPLRAAAAPSAAQELTAWWPLLIYGPWLVASLAILRSALHQRHARHSWAVVVLFSGLAVGLCVSQAPQTPTDIAVAGLPPVSALVAFHQVVRQMTLINPPRHALPRQRTARKESS